MIIHKVDQRTAEWNRLRRGIPTTSNFPKIVTPIECKPSKSARPYMFRLVAERLLNENFDFREVTEWMERGIELEPKAANRFEIDNECVLDPGYFLTDDSGRWGCSPDRIIRGRNEAVEIKCKAPWNHIAYLIDGLEYDYKPQVQGQMMVGEFNTVHFYAYSDLLQPMHRVILPDTKYIKDLHQHLTDFCDKLDETTHKVRRMLNG